MNNYIKIEKTKLQQRIEKFDQDSSLMLSISEPHIRIKRLIANGDNLEPVIDQIIKLVNRYVFGKHKKFESLKGIIVEENPIIQPHYHFLLCKPDYMEFNVFKRKMEQVSTRLCSEDFKLDLRDSNLSNSLKNTLSTPCYNTYSKATEIHENIGSYLTKGIANYYILDGRKFSRKDECLNLWVSYGNGSNQYERIIENNNDIGQVCIN